MKYRKYKDEAWLRREYIENDRTQLSIANECKISKTTINRWIGKFGLEKPKRKRDGYYKVVTITIDDYYVKRFNELVGKDKIYTSRSEAMRSLLREYLQERIKDLEELKDPQINTLLEDIESKIIKRLE